jgi:hypothetical protein
MLSFKYDTIGDHPECQYVRGVIPTNGVYQNAYAADATPAFSSAAAGTVLNARAIKPETGTARLFLGSATKIEELTSSGITDRSKSGGYNNTSGWSFSQGIAASEIVAANIGYTIQVSTGGAFSDLTNAPKATIVLAQSRALLALNYDDGTSAPNGIKISDRGSSTTWTAAASNDAVAIKLVETPGEIYAGATLNDLVIAWKRQSMYIGRFVGGSEKWQFNLLSPSVGCFGPEAWAATPAGIIFAGPAGVYLFDGSVPREIDQGVRQLILNYIGSENTFGYKVQISHDEYSGCVFIWIPDAVGASDTDNFLCFAYNYREGRWSIPYPIHDKVNNAYYDFGLASPTDLQAIVRDLTLFDYNKIAGANARYVGHFVVAGDKKVYNLSSYSTGVAGGSYAIRIQSGRIKVAAPPDTDLVLRRVYPVWGTGRLFSGLPTSTAVLKCTVNAYDVEHYERNGGSSTTTVTYDNDRQRFDVFLTGKMFDVEIYTAAGVPVSLKDIRFDLVPVGKT